ncbi:MAG: amino acid permease, partial [Sphingomonadales bacterium]
MFLQFFFTFIGFDAVSTMAEETKDPQRNLPRGMFYSLLICTVLYVLISLVLTGMMPYEKLGVDDPLATVLQYKGIVWLEYLVSISAVVAMASVLLVF